MLTKLFKSLTIGEDSSTPKKEVKPLKVVKLFTEDGTLLEIYNGVHMERWDTNVYFIYTKEDGELITRIDKGANMMLISENVK